MNMSNIVPFQRGGMPAVFANRALPDMNAAAKAGLAPSFAVIGYKGRNWRLKYAGEEELLKEANGAPVATLDVVIVGISSAISKIFYEKKYQEGDDQAPDCWSTDGLKPDAAAPKKQSVACANCPQGQWGSRVTDAGKKAKNCQDSRRLVVVPADDVENDGYGGPMLLRLPPMSLSNLAAYTRELEKYGAQPYAVRTVLGFNYDVAYPEITFQTTGWLDNDTAEQVADLIENDTRITTILAESSVVAEEAPTGDAADPEFANKAPASPLAAGRPAGTNKHGKTPAQVQAEADAIRAKTEAERQAAAEAKARAEAEEAERAKAAAAQAAAAAPPPKKNSPFGKKAATPPAAVSTNHTVNSAPVTVKPAPQNMEAAIDALL
jgi:hypothetical protein